MCGIIVGLHTGKEARPANEWALKTFENQHSRGMEGFGIIGWKPGSKPIVLRSCEGIKFMWDIHSKDFPLLLVHHRTPTSTPNSIEQTHPILVRNGSLSHDYLILHNGIIRNDEAIWKKHTAELGFVYTTEIVIDKEKNLVRWNDSESLAIEAARFIEGQTGELEITGSAAFVALQLDKETGKPTLLFFGRNQGNPLKMGKSRGKLHLSSEGEGDPIDPFILYSCPLTHDMKLTKKPLLFKKEEEIYKPVYSWEREHRTSFLGKKSEDLKTWKDDQLKLPEARPLIPSADDDALYEFPGGGGFDESSDFPIEQIYQNAISDIEDAATECLDALSNPETLDFAPIDATMKAIRDFLETAKEQFALALEEKAKQLEKTEDTYGPLPICP